MPRNSKRAPKKAAKPASKTEAPRSNTPYRARRRIPTRIVETAPTADTPEARETFLDELRKGWSVTRALRKINADRRTVYRWREKDEEFAEAWDHAIRVEGVQYLEDAARSRGVNGVDEPIYQGGVLVGHRRRYSDTLLMHQLEARDPDKYRKRSEVLTPNALTQNNILVLAGAVGAQDALRMYQQLTDGSGGDQGSAQGGSTASGQGAAAGQLPKS